MVIRGGELAGIIWKIYGLDLCSIAYEVMRGEKESLRAMVRTVCMVIALSLRSLSERNTMRFTPSCVFCLLFLEEILQNLHVFLSDVVRL